MSLLRFIYSRGFLLSHGFFTGSLFMYVSKEHRGDAMIPRVSNFITASVLVTPLSIFWPLALPLAAGTNLIQKYDHILEGTTVSSLPESNSMDLDYYEEKRIIDEH